jgi:DNA-binding PadR family transcriptional regulator
MQKAGNMPERKVYSISAQGRKRLKKEMKEALLMIGAEDQPLNMAMTFGMGMSAREMIACLRERIDRLKEGEPYVKRKYDHLRQFDIYNGMIMTEAARKHIRIEIETARKFIRMLEKEPGYYSRMARQLEEAEGHDDCDETKTQRRKK